MKAVSVDDLIWFGRNLDHKGVRYFDYSASGFEFCFTGKKAIADILSDSDKWKKNNQAVIGVFVKEIKNGKSFKGDSFWEVDDEEPAQRIFLNKPENQVILFDSPVEKTVIIKVLKLSEVAFGYAGLKSLKINGVLNKGKSVPEKTNAGSGKSVLEKINTGGSKSLSGKNTFSTLSKKLKIEFIGDSITCGYGIEGIHEKDVFKTSQERADKSYAFLTARKLNAEFNFVSWSGIGLISKYVDESVDVPDTSITMPLLWPYTDKSLSLRLGLKPELWDETRFSPDIVVINLGTNDASFVRGKENRRLLYVNALRVFIEQVHARSPKAKICCCLGVMGQDLCKSVKDAVNLFKKDFPGVKIIDVKLPLQNEEKDGVGTDWHPSYKSHKKTADFLVKKLSEL